ncbi:MAG TPA: hypothetical protein VF487_17370 [Chitinophagaceae bacterium]
MKFFIIILIDNIGFIYQQGCVLMAFPNREGRDGASCCCDNKSALTFFYSF